MPVVPDVATPTSTIVPAEYLEIDGFSLSTPGWVTNDLSALLDDLDIRSDTEVIPGGTGTSIRSFAARKTVSKRDVPITVFGDVDGQGIPHPNPRYGAEANLLTIANAICTPAATMDGTRQGTLHLALGLMTARVKVVGSLGLSAFGGSDYRGVVQLELPYTRFTLVSNPPPTLLSASINGGQLRLVFSRVLDPLHEPLPTGLTISVNGAADLLNAGATISGDTLTATFAPVVGTDTVTTSYFGPYTPATNQIRAADGVLAGGFSGRAVTNTT